MSAAHSATPASVRVAWLLVLLASALPLPCLAVIIPMSDWAVIKQSVMPCKRYATQDLQYACAEEQIRYVLGARKILLEEELAYRDAFQIYNVCVDKFVIQRPARGDWRLVEHCVRSEVSYRRSKLQEAARKRYEGLSCPAYPVMCHEAGDRVTAEFYFFRCGMTDLDGDEDGIPCEVLP